MLHPTRSDYLNVPEELRHPKVKRWVCFKCIPQPDGKIKKLPLQPNGDAARVNDKETWNNFDTCMKSVEFGIGQALGFVVSKEFKIAFVDLDYAILPDGSLTPTAKKYLDVLKDHAYIERSISGNGIHVFIWYTGKDVPTNPEPGVELYTDDRFAIMTGVLL